MQAAFRDNHGLQCGFCTPGMIMSAIDIVKRHGGKLDEQTVRHELEGNHLPLHRLPQHRQGRAGRRGPHEGCAGRRIADRVLRSSTIQRIFLAARAKNERAIRGPTGRDTMGMEGIGASVVRKEDKRFITGKGRYTDDIRLHGMTYAQFIRSPHAHARIKSIDAVGGAEDAGRGRSPDRQAAGRRQGRQSDLRLDDPFQGRHADENGRLPGAGAGSRALCRPGRRGRHRRQQEPGARRRRSRDRELRRVTGGRRHQGGDRARCAAAAPRSARQHRL